MKIGLVIYGSIETVSGGYLYDRKLVTYLRSRADDVPIISVRPGSYFCHLLDNWSVRLPSNLDVIIEDELVHASLLVANRARRAAPEIPVLSLVHNLHSSEKRAAWQNVLYRQLETEHLASVDAYIFNSPATRDTVSRLVRDAKPYVIAPPGGDRLGSLTADAVHRRLAQPGPLRLLFLANVTPLKGLHVVLDALGRLPVDSCRLDVAGSLAVDARYAKTMRERAAALSVPVTFHGVLNNQPLADLLAATHVVVLPSFYEGFGIAYLEGMAFGAPAIGTTAGAIPQMIEQGVNGYMIAPGDSAALADYLTSLISDRDLLTRMSLNALQSFRAHPTWEQSAAAIREFLARLITGS
jgi:glycosyltransferase involved in cell wall biosynthesis